MDSDSSDEERRRYKNLVARRHERLASASKNSSTRNRIREDESKGELKFLTPMEPRLVNSTPIVVSLATPIASARDPSPRIPFSSGSSRTVPTGPPRDIKSAAQTTGAVVKRSPPSLGIERPPLKSSGMPLSMTPKNFRMESQAPKVPPLRLDKVSLEILSTAPEKITCNINNRTTAALSGTRKQYGAELGSDSDDATSSVKPDSVSIITCQLGGRKKIRFSDSDDSGEESHRPENTSIRLQRVLQPRPHIVDKASNSREAEPDEEEIHNRVKETSTKNNFATRRSIVIRKDDFTDSDSEDNKHTRFTEQSRDKCTDLASQVHNMASELKELKKQIGEQKRLYEQLRQDMKAEIASIRSQRGSENFDPQKSVHSAKSRSRPF